MYRVTEEYKRERQQNEKEKLTHILETTENYPTAKKAIHEYCYRYDDDDFPFSWVTKLTPVSAKALALYMKFDLDQGGDNELWLDSLTELSEPVARKLAKARVQSLSFDSLKRLSDETVKILTGSYCDELFIPNVKMTEEVLICLSKFRGEMRDLFIPSGTSLETLKLVVGADNVRFEDPISVEIAKILVDSSQILTVHFKHELSVEAATELAKHLRHSRLWRDLYVEGPTSKEAREILSAAGAY
jgi:hypothetical protein